MRAVVVMPRAQQQLRAAERWWLQYRDKAPAAFDEDLEEIFDLLAINYAIGRPVRAYRPGIRRILAERVRYYVYYRLNARDEVEVISVWHASRRPPRL